MKYIKNEAYKLRNINSVFVLVPYKRTENGLKIFNFNYIGAEIINQCEKSIMDVELKKIILTKYGNDGLDEKTYDDFINQLIKFKIIIKD